jgi:hypothetical protein
MDVPCACCREPQPAGRELCDACGGRVAGSLRDDEVPMECAIALPPDAVATHFAVCRVRLVSRLMPADDVTLTLEGRSLESPASAGFGRLSALVTEPASQVKEEDVEILPVRAGTTLLTIRVACTLPDGTSIACQGVINNFQVADTSAAGNRSYTVNISGEMMDNRGMISALDAPEAGPRSTPRTSRDEWRTVSLKRIALQGDHKPCPYCQLLCDRQAAKCALCGLDYPPWWRWPAEQDAQAALHAGLMAMVLWPASGGSPQQRHYLHFKDALTLGRDFRNDVPVRRVPWDHRRNGEISATSVRLARVGERLVIERAGKSAVTLDDTVLGDRSRLIADHALLNFGGLLQVEVNASRTAEVKLPERPGTEWGATHPLAAVRLTRLGDGQDVETHVMMPRWGVLGSADQADVRVRGPGVDAQHARLTVLDGVLHVSPLKDGVYVNERKARPRALTPVRPGAKLTVASLSFHALRYEPAPVRPDNEW